MNGFEYAQGVHDNLGEPNADEQADDAPECGGCSPAYRNACLHCSDYDG